MPTVEELFRRLGPTGVRQLNDLFNAGGFSEEEKEDYIRQLSGEAGPQAAPNVGRGLGGITPAPVSTDPQRGPLPSSTPSFAPYRPEPSGPPVAEPIARSPRAQGPVDTGGGGPNWGLGLMTLGAGLGSITRGGGGGGGNVVAA